MKPEYFVVVLVALCGMLSTGMGLKCYSCSKGLQTMNHCDDFEKADEAERKSRFSMNCPGHATGCAYMKFDLDNGQREIYTESLECYIPDARLKKLSNMNSCMVTEDGKSVWKVCTCDTGDYCVDLHASAPSGLTGSGSLFVLIMASVTILKGIL